jgi:para-aminobenzoate synthetase component I
MISALDWDDAPADVAARWPADQPLLWLHSGRLHSRWARWSIMASPRAVWQFERGRSMWTGDVPPQLAGVRFAHDALADLDAILNATRLDHDVLPPSDLPFCGGWIGFFSYDLGRVIEPKAQHHDQSGPAAWPLIELAWCPEAVVFDHLHRKWMCVGDRAVMERITHTSAAASLGPEDFHLGKIRAEMAASQYEAMVARTVEYIAAGDIFQANIAQRLLAEFEGSTRALAIAAFASAQPWYGAYLESPAQPVVQASLPALGPGRHGGLPHDHHARRALLSLSPELFLETDPAARTRRVITRPIKGTRPIACDPRELRDSIKDEAELNMIVDLMRNDLGRVCDYGSVRVTKPRLIETHPTVHHGVAEIEGTLRAGTSVRDLLRATFPPGSVTGAPKIRAMQIIDELEGAGRGPYCGAIGFISDCGGVTLNVAIRTLLLQGRGANGRCDVLHDGEASYSAGAGIVADSVPAREWQETLDKAAALRSIPRARAAAVVA